MLTEAPDNGKFTALVDYCTDFFDTTSKSEYRTKKLKEIEESRKKYEQEPDDAKKLWEKESDLVLPFTTITVDNLEPRLVSGIVARDPIVKIEGYGDDAEEILEDWFNGELKHVVKVEELGRDYVHTLLLEGTYFCIPWYRIKKKVRREFIFNDQGAMLFNEQNTPVLQDVVDKVHEGGLVEQIPCSHLYFADDLGTIEEWEEADKIREVDYTYGELMRKGNEDGWMNVGPWILPEKRKQKLKEEEKDPSQAIVGVDVTGKENIKCLECHITFPVANLVEDPPEEEEQTDFYEEKIICTITKETKKIIRFLLLRDLNMNNESLIKRGRLFPEKGRSFGTSIYGKLKAIQNGASDIFNQVLNVADISMVPWYFYDEGMGLPTEVEIYPGCGVPVPDVSKILFPKFNVNPNQYVDFVNIFVSFWERLLNIAEPQVGKPTSNERTTATEILAVIEEGNIRHNYQSKTFKEEFIEILRALYDLYYQWMPYDKTHLYGGNEIPLPRHLMRRPSQLRLMGSTEKANKLIERKEAEDLSMTVGNNPLYAPLANPVKLLKDHLKSYGKENPDDYIAPQITQLIASLEENPELPQVIQEYLQGKQQTAMRIEGIAP